MTHRHSLRVKVREFHMPPINDGVVLGREAPIGCQAFRRALELLVVAPFEHIELEDEVVGAILVRRALLRRISKEYLTDFVLQRIKPLMGPEEILHLDLHAEIWIEEESL
ncbi:MAG TPA: hypothetical protein VNL74_09885 [Methylococcus sp.]|nr:hypothetical protein [Methylococcus sp.]